MSPPVEHACARCAHPNDTEALTCSACGAYLLVDLRVEEPIADPRRRYYAAKTIAAKGRPFPEIGRASRSLEARGSILVSGMSRAAAIASVEALGALGIKTRIAPAGEAVLTGPAAVPTRTAAPAKPSASGPRLPFLQGVGYRLPRGLLLTLPAAAAVILVLRFALGPSATPPASERSAQGPGPATPRPEPHAASSREIADRALDATAMIRCRDSAGAGFFIAADLLVTNHHVLCPTGESMQVVMRSGRKLDGFFTRGDSWLDLALVRVPGADAVPISLGDTTALAVGDRVLAVGNPLGLGFSVNQGMISHRQRELLGVGYLQFDGNINPGNSGGPLVDDQGKAVGVVSMTVGDSKGLAFAIPVNYLYAPSRGSSPLVPDRSDSGNAEKWREYLSTVLADEEREVDELRSAFHQPGLAAAGIGTGGIGALVFRRSGSEPLSEELFFRLSMDGRSVCRASGVFQNWRHMGAPDAGGGSGEARYMEWMRRHGVATELWVAAARVNGAGCNEADPASNLELVLENGDPHAGRVRVQRTRS